MMRSFKFCQLFDGRVLLVLYEKVRKINRTFTRSLLIDTKSDTPIQFVSGQSKSIKVCRRWGIKFLFALFPQLP